MKNFIKGILFLLLSVALIHVGYSSNVPTIKNYQLIEKGKDCVVNYNALSEDDDWFMYTNSTGLLAQAETNSDVSKGSNDDNTYTEADVIQAQAEAEVLANQNTEEKLVEIAKALHIEVDPNISQEDLYKQIIKQSETVPKKDDSPSTWISWIWAGIGTLISGILLYKNKLLKKSS